MEIIVEGHKIDTKDIWEIKDLSTGRQAGFKICLVGDREIKIVTDIPYERTPSQIHDAHRPYDNLRKSIEEKWKADQTDIPVFKLK